MNDQQREQYQEAYRFLMDGDHELVVFGVLKKLHVRQNHQYYDDLVQEGKMCFAEKYIQLINQDKQPESGLVFIYQGVYWHLLDWLRKETRQSTGIEYSTDKQNDPLEDLMDDGHAVGFCETHILSHELMAMLNEREANYLRLAYEQGLNMTEIAKACGVSRKTVHGWRNRVIEKLKNEF